MIHSDFVRRKNALAVGLSLLFAFAARPALAHKGHHHASEVESIKKSKAESSNYQKINQDYLSAVKPIFDTKCADCHGGATHLPWYYSIPGAKQLIDRDIAESKEHLDFSKGFPFGGHGTPMEDLDAIADVTQDGSMPPMRYWVMHLSSKLDDQDRATILNWVERSKKTLTSH